VLAKSLLRKSKVLVSVIEQDPHLLYGSARRWQQNEQATHKPQNSETASEYIYQQPVLYILWQKNSLPLRDKADDLLIIARWAHIFQ